MSTTQNVGSTFGSQKIVKKNLLPLFEEESRKSELSKKFKPTPIKLEYKESIANKTVLTKSATHKCEGTFGSKKIVKRNLLALLEKESRKSGLPEGISTHKKFKPSPTIKLENEELVISDGNKDDYTDYTGTSTSPYPSSSESSSANWQLITSEASNDSPIVLSESLSNSSMSSASTDSFSSLNSSASSTDSSLSSLNSFASSTDSLQSSVGSDEMECEVSTVISIEDETLPFQPAFCNSQNSNEQESTPQEMEIDDIVIRIQEGLELQELHLEEGEDLIRHFTSNKNVDNDEYNESMPKIYDSLIRQYAINENIESAGQNELSALFDLV